MLLRLALNVSINNTILKGRWSRRHVVTSFEYHYPGRQIKHSTGTNKKRVPTEWNGLGNCLAVSLPPASEHQSESIKTEQVNSRQRLVRLLYVS